MVLHPPPALVPSSAGTTSGSPFSRPGPGTWCFIHRYPLFLRRQAPRPAPHFPDRAWGRGASSPTIPCFFVGKHHVRLPIFPTEPGDVVPHCPPALISSSASTTSSAPKCRPAPGTWCLIPRQPLFLRRQAPRPPLQSAGQPRGRGTSLPASPYFFVGRHHVLRSKVPGSPGGVVPHSPLSLVPSSAGTTSGGSSTRPASHAAGYCKISIFLDKCVLKGNFFYGIISIRRYSI